MRGAPEGWHPEPLPRFSLNPCPSCGELVTIVELSGSVHCLGRMRMWQGEMYGRRHECSLGDDEAAVALEGKLKLLSRRAARLSS